MYEKFQSTKNASRNFPPKHYIHNASGLSTTVLNLLAEKEPLYEKDYFGKTFCLTCNRLLELCTFKYTCTVCILLVRLFLTEKPLNLIY